MDPAQLTIRRSVQHLTAAAAPLIGAAASSMGVVTGSTATGKKILEGASKSLKRVVLECGGKDPMVVMADADVDVAAKDAVDFSLANCGQVCCAVERVYVADEIYPAFEAKVVEHAKSYVAGNGLETASTIGPLVSEMQRQTVHRHVEAAQKAGTDMAVASRLKRRPRCRRSVQFSALQPQQQMRKRPRKTQQGLNARRC